MQNLYGFRKFKISYPKHIRTKINILKFIMLFTKTVCNNFDTNIAPYQGPYLLYMLLMNQ